MLYCLICLGASMVVANPPVPQIIRCKQPAPAGYRVITPSQKESLTQKILIGTGADNRTVFKTADGKIISLQALSQNSGKTNIVQTTAATNGI